MRDAAEVCVVRGWPRYGLYTGCEVIAVRVSTIAALVLSTILAPAAVSAQTQPDVVVVTGEGLVKAAPDQAWVTLVAEHRARNSREAQAQTAQSMTAIQQKLAAGGIAKDAIRTIAAELNIDAEWVNGRQVPKGYVARNIVEVRIDDVTKVGEVMDARGRERGDFRPGRSLRREAAGVARARRAEARHRRRAGARRGGRRRGPAGRSIGSPASKSPARVRCRRRNR